ncbi:hypothetical protein FQA39_LY18514 [Lamprigera yunnana]|nr:hypothetical protein FQA39_LY18514 [Lamprigera yunnana]
MREHEERALREVIVAFRFRSAKSRFIQAEAQAGHQIYATVQAEDFVKSLEQPRAIMLLVPAGAPVDGAIQTSSVFRSGRYYYRWRKHLFLQIQTEDIRTFFKRNPFFFGMGISGGRDGGPRRGQCMMPGGDKVAYERLRPIFEAIAAKVDGEPCVEFLGNGSAGKLCENGTQWIEYGIMQLIAETYDIMKNVYHLDHETHATSPFEQWNKEELNSFLIEITADILKQKEGDKYLVDLISDWAKPKEQENGLHTKRYGFTGSVPVIECCSNHEGYIQNTNRKEFSSKLLTWKNDQGINNVDLNQLKEGLFFAIITTYAQGLAQLKIASET